MMVALHALNTLFAGWLGFYRGELYGFPPSAWALAASVGVLGLLAPALLPEQVRARLLTGGWPLVLAVPVLVLLVGPRVVPSPLTVGPLFFCASASLSTCLLVTWNVSRRRGSVRRLLESSACDDLVSARLEAYLQAQAAVIEEGRGRNRNLRRALRAQAWVPSQSRREHAAAVLRDYAAFAGDACEKLASVPPPAEALRSYAQIGESSSERLHDGLLALAADLEQGGRLFRWRSWLAGLAHADLDADRDHVYALDLLARREAVARPPAFRFFRRHLAWSPLTPLDISPPWSGGIRVAKPAAVALAALTALSAVVGTATAQKPAYPPDDGMPLPTIAGPSTASRVEPRLSRTVTTLADRPTEVRCWSSEDWSTISAMWARVPAAPRLGRWSAYTSRDRRRIHLAPAVCASLVRLAYGRTPVAEDSWPAALAWSVAALAHETQHVRGIGNEATAECYALQRIGITAQALGRPEHEGLDLADLYWTQGYPNHEDSAYRSAECRDGGRLDLDPTSDTWP
jgi:hypothetical protein